MTQCQQLISKKVFIIAQPKQNPSVARQFGTDGYKQRQEARRPHSKRRNQRLYAGQGHRTVGDEVGAAHGSPRLDPRGWATSHFGRELPEFTWEKTDKVDALRAACGL